jgi:phospholipid-translocating ATPase
MSTSKDLAYFRNECKTRIVADAGPEGLGAVLLQLQGEEWRAVSYASKNLAEVERRYAQTEKGALALVWACERFNLYVYGREFELETDHKPLQCIFGKSSKPSARIERWILRLQCHHYNVVCRPGNTNIADALLRLNQPKPKGS